MTDDIITLNASYSVPIILLGDFNARTGECCDFIEHDESPVLDNTFLDITSDYTSYFISNNMYARKNKDMVLNNNGHMLIDLCKTSDLKW